MFKISEGQFKMFTLLRVKTKLDDDGFVQWVKGYLSICLYILPYYLNSPFNYFNWTGMIIYALNLSECVPSN